jgi:photosynthetic reaction center cytochrome c subunit
MDASRRIGSIAGLVLALGLLAGCEPPTAESTQNGYRGTGMLQLQQPDRAAELAEANVAPESAPPVPSAGPKAGDVYENVQVLGDLSVGEFNRLMAAMTAWVSPEEGCNYCHVQGNLASDDVYTKVVSRRMVQMTQHVNGEWDDHVGETGVTCYTCHRGKNVPDEIWFLDPGPETAAQFAGNRMGQNTPGKEASAYSTLPYDPFSPFIVGDEEIRVQPVSALPTDHVATIRETEYTYSLMMHMSDSLGVNCTFCHNSRAFGEWEQSTPQRVTSWHGIRMARDLNANYLDPLQPVYPDHRLGPLDDAPKANCATCHQGVNKPLMGAQMAKDYPSLSGG